MAMKKEEMIKRLEKACEADDLFPGVLGNPVTFAARWGLPLSKSYLKHLDGRRSGHRRNQPPTGKRPPVPRRISKSADR